MTNETYELSGFLLTLQRAGCSKATVADVLKTVPTFLGIDADDRKRIDARLREDRASRLEKANAARMEWAGPDPHGFEAEERRKRVKKSLARDERVKAPGSVFAPIDLTGSPNDRDATLRRLDLEARKAPAYDEALDIEEDENAEGSANNPVDLVTKNTERFSFGRASRVKARGTSAKTKRTKRSR